MPNDDDLDVTRHDDYVVVRFSGAFSPAAGREVVDAMAKASQEQGLARILLDCREMSGDLTILGRFEVAEYGARVISRDTVVALVGREEDILPDHFFESAAQSRGVRVKVFTNDQEAVAWLRSH